MSTILQDLRYAVRLLRKSPGFTIVAALTVALGIAATSTIFSAVNSTLLKPPPGVHDPGTLVRIRGVAQDGSPDNNFSYPNYRDYRDADLGLQKLGAWMMTAVVMRGDAGESELMFGALASHEFLGMLGVRPLIGRFFLPEEDSPGTGRVAVLSHGTWMRRFGGDPEVIGRTVNLNGIEFEVVGVAQKGFRGPVAVLEFGVWLPMQAAPLVNSGTDMESRADTWVDMIGRRDPDVGPARIEAAMNVTSARLRAEYPDGNPDYGVTVERYAPISRRALGLGLAFSVLLLAVSGIVLLIASLNVGGMLLARVSQRSREVAMRLALGAARGRVVRQLLIENILLFSLGGLGGVLLTIYLTQLMSTFQLPFDMAITFDFAPDLRVLAFTLIVAGLTGAGIGLLPALQATKSDLHSMIRGGPGAGFGNRSRLKNSFVILQVAGSAFLLASAGLFARGLARAYSIDTGFQPDGIHALSTELDMFGYNAEEAAAFYRDLSERAAQLPGMESVALVDAPPVTIGGRESGYSVGGAEIAGEEDGPSTDLTRITRGYFETIRIPLLRGRSFTSADREGTVTVAIVNETFATRNWPGEDPIGNRIRLAALENSELMVVGVARNAKYRTLTEQPRSMVYVPYAQWPGTSMVLFARVSRPEASVAGPLRQIVSEIDPAVGIGFNAPYREMMGLALIPARIAALFASVVGAVGLLLAALGLYGVLAYTVSQRTREIGIRVALGAAPGRVRRVVIQEGVRLSGFGVAIGFAFALAVTHLMRGLLFGLSPMDPVTFAAIALILLGTAVAASAVPAVRATRISPIEALRSE